MKPTIGPALFAMALLIPAANATTITFGTGGTSGFTTGGTTTVTVNNAAGSTGLNVTVTAGATTACNTTCLITANGAGFGVNSGAPGTNDTDPSIDGTTRLDTLTITFNNSVRITGIGLGEWDNNDAVGIYNGATLLQTYSANTASVALNSVGTTFQFRATGGNDDFRIQSITFSEVPEPATFALMGAALAGLGLMARKRTQRS